MAAPDADPPAEDPPSLREQIGATKASLQRLVGAHVELAKAEIGDVLDEVKRVAALAGIAVAAAIAAGLLLAVGLPLFLGELIFGSIGWGVLHGLLFLLAIGVAAIVIALGVGASAVGRALGVGVVVGVVVGILLGLNLTNRAWDLAGATLLPLADADPRPLATALVALPVVAGVLVGLMSLIQGLRGDAGHAGAGGPEVGERLVVAIPTALYIGWLTAFIYAYSARVAWSDLALVGVAVAAIVISLAILVVVGGWRPGYALISGMAIGTVVGVVLAGLTALAVGWRVGSAIGVTVGLVTWLGVMGAEVARRGVDGDELMKRFIPQRTIDITKETIEWVRARTPLSRRS